MRPYLIDVSRLIWRVWRGRLPTGIDRVCLRYVEHFGSRSLAVVQWKGRHVVLSAVHSDRLFALLGIPAPGARHGLVRLAAGAALKARAAPPRRNMIYLNVGHTGLDDPALPRWIAKHQLRAVYLFHDLIPLTHPEHCRPGEPAKHARRVKHMLASAHAVIGNSQTTLDELAVYARSQGLPLPPLLPALLGGQDATLAAPARTLERPYFLVLGTIEGRKNHLIVLQVWKRLIARLGDDAPMLVIIGQRGWEAEAAKAMLDRCFGASRQVVEIGRCGDEELAGWLAGARALLMPSFAEGFGLPVIEALESGTSVIASNLPVFREIAGDIPLYLDPLDGPAWEDAVLDYAGPSPLREAQLERMRDYKSPDWPSHFAELERFLADL